MVPLSRDKGRRKNPGTNFLASGCPGTKLLTQKSKKLSILHIYAIFRRKLAIVPSQVRFGFWQKNSDCSIPVPDFDRLSQPATSVGKILSLSHFPLSWDNEGTSVPLSRKVANDTYSNNDNNNIFPIVQSTLSGLLKDSNPLLE